MTRVTNDLRDELYRKIMAGLPTEDYIVPIHDTIQKIVAEHMPKEVRAIYDDPVLRKYLRTGFVDVRAGNKSVPLYRHQRCDEIYGLRDRMTIRMDDAASTDLLPDGSLYKELVTELKASGLVRDHFAREALRENVSKRLRANLASAKTFKQLYDIMEPELHHLIPKDEVKAALPSCVAPVVDDLRKLGASLPSVPKAPKVSEARK